MQYCTQAFSSTTTIPNVVFVDLDKQKLYNETNIRLEGAEVSYGKI